MIDYCSKCGCEMTHGKCGCSAGVRLVHEPVAPFNQAMAGLSGINSGFGQRLGQLGSVYSGQQAGNLSLRRREGSLLRELAEVRRLINDRDLPDIADFERSG